MNSLDMLKSSPISLGKGLVYKKTFCVTVLQSPEYSIISVIKGKVSISIFLFFLILLSFLLSVTKNVFHNMFDTCETLHSTFMEQTSPEQTLPQHSAFWEIRATSGRYASYWNAILLLFCFSHVLLNWSWLLKEHMTPWVKSKIMFLFNELVPGFFHIWSCRNYIKVC